MVSVFFVNCPFTLDIIRSQFSEEISLEDFIKNLPLKSDHRQFQPKSRRRHRLADRETRDVDAHTCLVQDIGKRTRNETGMLLEVDDDEDDDDDDIKSIESEDEENVDEDIMIEEVEITTTVATITSTSTDNDENSDRININAIHAFRIAHKNESIIDVPDRNNSVDSYGSALKCSVFLVTLCSVLIYVVNVNTVRILY